MFQKKFYGSSNPRYVYVRGGRTSSLLVMARCGVKTEKEDTKSVVKIRNVTIIKLVTGKFCTRPYILSSSRPSLVTKFLEG